MKTVGTGPTRSRAAAAVAAAAILTAAAWVGPTEVAAQYDDRADTWQAFQRFVQDEFQVDVGRLHEVSPYPPVLARNLGLTYGYALGRLRREGGDDPDHLARLSDVEGMLRASLAELVRVQTILVPAEAQTDIAAVLLDARGAAEGDFDAEVAGLFRAIGGRVPARLANPSPWMEERDSTALAPEGGEGAGPGSAQAAGPLFGNLVVPGPPDWGRQALVSAVEAGDFDQVRWLLSTGTDPDAPDPETGETPLMRAPSASIAAELIRFGARVGRRDARGGTALHHVVQAPDAVRLTPLLVARGAEPDVRAPGWSGMTPLLVAGRVPVDEAQRERSEWVIRFLAGVGSDVNTADDRGHTLLDRAVLDGDARMAALALEIGTDPAHRAADGRTTLELARDLDDETMVRMLERWEAARKP